MQRSRYLALGDRIENFLDSRDSLNDITTHPGCFDPRMAVISEIEEHEHKIVNEFCHLLDKSKQLFNGLR